MKKLKPVAAANLKSETIKQKIQNAVLNFELAIRRMQFLFKQWYKNPSRYIRLDIEMFPRTYMNASEADEKLQELKRDVARVTKTCDVSADAELLKTDAYVYGIKLSLNSYVQYRKFKPCLLYLWNIIPVLERHFNASNLSRKHIYVEIPSDEKIPEPIKQLVQENPAKFSFLIEGTLPTTSVKYKIEDYRSIFEGPVNDATFPMVFRILTAG